MSGGGFVLSKSAKFVIAGVAAILFGLSILSFIKAFPFDNVLISILLLVVGLVLLILALILFALTGISRTQ